jgi:hypothetical protein
LSAVVPAGFAAAALSWPKATATRNKGQAKLRNRLDGIMKKGALFPFSPIRGSGVGILLLV